MGKKINKTVFVGISGGVDSSVAAILLKEQGYKVIGVFIRTWTPDFIKCTWKEERLDAIRICAYLNIPYLECDAEDAYKKNVADYMIDEYKRGNTPNPDVMCNKEIKFGVFWDFAKKRGADFIATGHYTKNYYNIKSNNYELKKSIDKTKDQSYFLWTLKQEDLKHIIFPLGNLNKKKVREIAEKYKLFTASKKDSQGVCFLGALDMKKFLKNYLPIKLGKVIDEEGNIIGTHEGVNFFTIGERHGFKINNKFNNDKPLYVISKNIENNSLVVSENFKLNLKNKTNIISGIKYNWILNAPIKNKQYEAQIRYHGDYLKCKINILNNENIMIIFSDNLLVDKGQSIVFFENNTCLGGCIVG